MWSKSIYNIIKTFKQLKNIFNRLLEIKNSLNWILVQFKEINKQRLVLIILESIQVRDHQYITDSRRLVL